jgi:alpha-galactosidase
LGIRVFKIDGIELSNKTDEINVRRFFEKIKEATNGKVVFNMDVTAGQRMGYFYFLEYGNLFLENRYTDWGNYYPHRTLRNIWMLSEYVPSEKIQVEFLNKWRNADKYLVNDPIAPSNIPFDYIVATTFAGQPLTWMEVSNLPEEALKIKGLLSDYKKMQHDFHKGIIMPVGEEPNGLNWTGFQSVESSVKGYFLIFREFNNDSRKNA